MQHLMISTMGFHFNATPLAIGLMCGHLSITGYVRIESGGCSKISYVCKCACGKICVKYRSQILAQDPHISCGCTKRPQKKRGRPHNYKAINHDADGNTSPTYRSWAMMIQRCKNKKMKTWADYGGRGIIVCEQWKKFDNFLADMGERPKDRTLDRIDVNGNYEPGNCRWATKEQQAENTRVAKHFTLDGKTLTIAGWSRYLGICSATMIYRIKHHGYEGAIRMGGQTPVRDFKTENVTGFRGVGKRGSRFFAQIQLKGVVTYLGAFDTAEEAHAAYLAAR